MELVVIGAVALIVLVVDWCMNIRGGQND